MNIKCRKTDLNQAVQIVQKAAAAKNQMPILTGIYMHATDNRLELQATDYEIGISCTIPAEVEKEGSVVLSGKYLQELVRKMPGESIEISLSTENRIIQITSNFSQFNLISLPSEEFPVIKQLKSDNTYHVKDCVLRELIKKTVFACAQDEARPIFTGGLLELYGDQIAMVATNTHRLALKQDTGIQHVNEKIQVIIPAKILNELSRILVSDLPQDVSISFLKNQIAFSVDNIYIISRLIEGQFPDYNKVIPASFATIVKLDTDEFLGAVERVSLLAREGDYNVIKLSFKNNSITISSNNPEIGKACETVPAEISGSEIDIAFNAKYITDVLKNISSSEMTFSLNTPLSPACIKPVDDETYTYIITPVRTN